jgi:hypothetical protein
MKKLIIPKYHHELKTNDGIIIDFKFNENTHTGNKGFVDHNIEAFVNGIEAGFIKISYVDKEEYKHFNPSIFNHINNFNGQIIGLKERTISSSIYLDGARCTKTIEDTSNKRYELSSKEGLQTLLYRVSAFSIKEILEMELNELKEEYNKVEKKFIHDNKDSFDLFSELHINKPLISYIKTYNSDCQERGDFLNPTSDNYFRGKGIGKALYQMGSIWMGMNNMLLFRSDIQSNEAQSISIARLMKKNLVKVKEVKSLTSSSHTRYALDSTMLFKPLTKNRPKI